VKFNSPSFSALDYLAYLVLYESKVCAVEIKADSDLETLNQDRPNDWILDEEGYKYLPAVRRFAEMGIEHTVVPISSLSSLRADNLTYLEIVAEATGCSTLEHTTFLPLKAALSQNGHGIVRADRAWCPACLEEAEHSDAQFYDRLTWALPYIQRCPIHKVELMSNCPYCGSAQLHYHHLGHVELCCKCKRSLRSAPSTWRVISAATPYEKECLDLVSNISLGNLKVVDDAYGIFIREFNQYLLLDCNLVASGKLKSDPLI
jgi:TniQ